MSSAQREFELDLPSVPATPPLIITCSSHRKRLLYRQPPSPNPLHHRDDLVDRSSEPRGGARRRHLLHIISSPSAPWVHNLVSHTISERHLLPPHHLSTAREFLDCTTSMITDTTSMTTCKTSMTARTVLLRPPAHPTPSRSSKRVC